MFKDMIRTGAEFSIVELTFSVKDEIIKKIKDMDIYVGEDNTVTVTRKISEGRSVSKINGETVNIHTLKEIIGMLGISTDNMISLYYIRKII